MLTTATKRIRFCIALAGLALGLQACTAPTTALKPVAEQNQDNLAALATNVKTVLALYEPTLKATSTATIYQHIAKTEQEMIAVIGSPVLPAPMPDVTWESLFERASLQPIASREKYLERYRWVKSAHERGVSEDELTRLKRQEGWIFNTVANSDFIPSVAHELLKTLRELRQQAGTAEQYYRDAAGLLAIYDPKLAAYQDTIKAAEKLLDGLKAEMQQQVTMANIYAQAFSNFSDSKVDFQQTAKAVSGNLDSDQLMLVLDTISQKYLDKASAQEAAVDFLTEHFQQLLQKF